VQHLQAAHAGHVQVEHDAVGHPRTARFEEILAARVGVGLQAGSNTIQVLAQDNTPLTSVATLTIIYDPTKPTVKITGPTTADTYFTGIGTLLLAGTASDNRAVTQVTWTRTVTGFELNSRIRD